MEKVEDGIELLTGHPMALINKAIKKQVQKAVKAKKDDDNDIKKGTVEMRFSRN